MRESEVERLREDLLATVRELSSTYEELSLLYKLSEEFTGLGVEEICDVMLSEITSLIDVETAAVLFWDEDTESFFLIKYAGQACDFSPSSYKEILCESMHRQRPTVVCKVHENPVLKEMPFRSVLLIPFKGKKKRLGVLLIANKRGSDEFFSGEIKLLQSIASLAGVFIENALLSEQMHEFLLGAIKAFVKALESTSAWTAGHTERVTEYCIGIGKMMGLSSEEIEKLRVCALLHDIGKIATPNEILNKPGKLEENEWAEIRRHPLIGSDILSEMTHYQDVIQCIRYHHEHYDGSGIVGLKGEEIPLFARILAVADAFDAMTSDRPYRSRLPLDSAVKEIVANSGSQFDPQVVRAFLRWVRLTYRIELPESELYSQL